MTDPVATVSAEATPTVDDCWNRIGVHGDRSCPELARHVHCRNCPVHQAAARERLASDLPAGYVAEWTRHVSKPKPIAAADTRSVVIFRLGAEWLGLHSNVVEEVADVRPVHTLPHRRSGTILGLANVRGELLVCVSLGRILGVEPAPESKQDRHGQVRKRLLVVHRADTRAICPVDEVHGVHRFRDQELVPIPATVGKAASAYSKAVLPWRERSVGIIDDAMLFATLQRSLS